MKWHAWVLICAWVCIAISWLLYSFGFSIIAMITAGFAVGMGIFAVIGARRELKKKISAKD